ncbi:MAG: ferritin family protein [Candidatus Krumholzibacteriales bacterium]
MKSDKQTIDALEEAIYREIGAFRFYTTVAEEITNPGGKKKFEEIAGDEKMHREKLVSWYNKLSPERFEMSDEKIEKSEINGIRLNQRAGAEEALDIAIEAELRANEFYSEQAEKVDDEDLRELYLTLAEDEDGHYNLLVAEKNAMAGGFYWFDMDSTAFMED